MCSLIIVNFQALPVTAYDKAIDRCTPNRGLQIFEKLISGMYLGEIVRRIIADLNEKGLLFETK